MTYSRSVWSVRPSKHGLAQHYLHTFDMAKLFAGYEEDFKKAFRPVEARFSKQEAIDLQPIMNSFKTGFSLRDQSRWADAAKVFESVITTYEEGLGREHDLIVSARGHLAGLYVELERYQEAGGLFTICENISITKLGPTHPVTLQYSNSLFQVLINLRRTADARDKGESLLRTLVETQSNDNYQTLGVLLRLGSVYVNLSDYKTALDYHERALEGMERTVGFNNIDTIYTQFKLGALYAELGDMGKAANIYQQNRDICASTRGITNEAYLRAAVNLGSVQRLGGQDVEAEKTLRALLPPTGPDRKHPYWEKYIGRAANELIMLYKRLGRHDDVHKVQAWMDGDAQALLEVEKTDATHAHWSPRVGEDEEVRYSHICCSLHRLTLAGI
jgi:tetratricopeptide (TPR) repeat protein